MNLYRHKGDDPQVSHDSVVVVDAFWSPDGSGGWRIQNDELLVDAHVHDGISTVWSRVVVVQPGAPTVNCGGKMCRFVNLIDRDYFATWFEPVVEVPT